ncbi:MAG: BatB protein [Flavobacteriales bacterium]|nr:BatB protein [Flavobacteriales bacterium]
MDFARPELLNLFFILLVVILVFYIYYTWQKEILDTKFNQKTFQKINPHYSVFLKGIHFLFRILTLFFLIISLAGPRIGTKIKTVNREGVDIVFALDVSKSMLVEDVAPNRLLKSLQIVSKTIDGLVSDRVGMIVYAGEAYPLMPLSFDYSMAKLLLKTIDTDIVQTQGTDVSSALSLSNSFFDNKERSRIIFIISDGEDHQGDYDDAIKNISNNNTIVCAINIGSDSGGPIPVKKGNSINYKKDKSGEVVISKSDIKTLKLIASSCNGSFMKTQNTNDAIEFIFNNMASLDKSSEEEELYSDYEDQFQWFLGIALFFLIIDLILTEKKTNFIRQIIKK